ncbi:hypothetical protein N9L48_02000 [Psychrosphaera sp.]|nr:hypothetical protein [Psychrosphaera sp.]
MIKRRRTFGLSKPNKFIDRTRRRVARKGTKKALVNRRIKQANTIFDEALILEND